MRRRSTLIVVLGIAAMLLTPASSEGQTVSIVSGSGTVGGTAEVSTQLTTSSELFGWSWGVCHTGSAVEPTAVVEGSATEALNNGDGPDFYGVSILTGEGWTVGVLVSTLFDDTLDPGTNLEMDVATYQLNSTGSADVCFCDTLQPGVDPVTTLVVIAADGTAVAPTQVCGSVSVGDRFTFTAPDTTGSYNPSTGEGTFTVTPTITEDPSAPGFPSDSIGFSMGLGHDPAILNPVNVDPSAALDAINDGDGPEFFAPSFEAMGTTVGVIYALMGGTFLQFTTETEAIVITYDTVPGTLINDPDGATTSLVWSDFLADPQVNNIVVTDGINEFSALFQHGLVNLVPGGVFLRGDADGNADFNGLVDGLFILAFQFQGGPPPPCMDAADSDDSGDINGLVDGLFVLTFQFQGGPPPPPPGPFLPCGADPTPDVGGDLGCDTPPAC